MRELAADKPKHLLEVAGRPFLSYLLSNLVSAGASEIYLVIGHQASAAYTFARNSGYPVRVVNQFERLGEERYGTLMPLLAVEPELRGRELAVVNGDNYYTISDLAALLQGTTAGLAALEHEEPERFGVIALRSGGTLERILEKPQPPPSRLINVGLYRFTPAVWDIVPRVGISKRGEYEITDAMNLLAAREAVSVVRIAGPWLDLGRPEDIRVAESLIRSS